MKWTMFVERWPGGSSVEEAPTGDRLKTLASDMWKGAKNSGVTEMLFTIYDPRGVEWQTCKRVSGGSWRASWRWCSGRERCALVERAYACAFALLVRIGVDDQWEDGEGVSLAPALAELKAHAEAAALPFLCAESPFEECSS